MAFQTPQFLSHLSTFDLFAIAYLVLSMGAMTWMTSHGLFGRRPTGEMVAEYRLIWMPAHSPGNRCRPDERSAGEHCIFRFKLPHRNRRHDRCFWQC